MMYLISIYFDEKTEHKIRSYMKQIAKRTGNTYMLDGNVPPHITISAFQSNSEAQAREIFEKTTKNISAGDLQWVSVGMFFPNVIYLAPVLNEYLHNLSVITYKEAIREKVSVKHCYQPFSWLPHATLAKQLSKEQLKAAFEIMQNQFGAFGGRVKKIGLAKTNPYKDLIIFELK